MVSLHKTTSRKPFTKRSYHTTRLCQWHLLGKSLSVRFILAAPAIARLSGCALLSRQRLSWFVGARRSGGWKFVGVLVVPAVRWMEKTAERKGSQLWHMARVRPARRCLGVALVHVGSVKSFEIIIFLMAKWISYTISGRGRSPRGVVVFINPSLVMRSMFAVLSCSFRW